MYFKDLFYLQLVGMCTCVHVLREVREGVGYPAAGIIGVCEELNTGAGNQTHILYHSGKHC